MSFSSETKLILAIETSCDETGVCLLSASGQYPDTEITIHTNELATQIDAHQQYGGVFPSLAKRLHAENLPVLLEKILREIDTQPIESVPTQKRNQVNEWLSRHDGLADKLISIFETHGFPALDAVAVTAGPGLEPALWVGINVARAIALVLNIPVIPTNHMEGHLVSSLVGDDIADGNAHKLASIAFPAVALLVSGGHTELIHIKDWQQYKKVGQTRDDAAGEAFDKIGRLLGLPYPAGPHVSQLAKQARDVTRSIKDVAKEFKLPRPMLNSGDLDFSFSGLKTAAARLVEKNAPLSNTQKKALAYELEQAIVDILVFKTEQAVKKFNAKTLLVGGGVSANEPLRTELESINNTSLHISPLALAGDNAIMIGLAALSRYSEGVSSTSDISADSRLSL